MQDPSQSSGNHPLYDDPHSTGGDPQKRKPRQFIAYEGGAKQPVVTYLLLGVNITIFALNFIMPDLAQTLLLWGVADSQSIFQSGEFHRLFTSMFLHFDITHMLFNGLALYVIGRNVETIYGSLRFSLIYLLGGLAGSVLMSLVSMGGLGASGAVFAIFGAQAIHFWVHRELYGEYGRSQLRSALFFIVLNFAIGIFGNVAAEVANSNIRIGNSAHFGGLVGGTLLAYWIGPRFRVAREQSGFIQTPESDQPLPAIQKVVADSNPMQQSSWGWVGLYAIVLGIMIALGVIL